MKSAMVRVPVPELDDTFLGVRVEVTGAGETRTGGISDLHRCDAQATGCPTGMFSPLLGQSRVQTAHTHVWMGGWCGVLVDDDVVLAPAPPPEYSAPR